MRGLLKDYTSRLAPGGFNLAPLIDVVFQLVLFFMVTSSFSWFSGMQVKVPKASSAVVDRPFDVVTIEVKRSIVLTQPEHLIVRWWEQGIEGEILWPFKENEDPMAGLATLKMKLGEFRKVWGEKPPSIVIAAEDSVPYQGVVTVMDMCQQLGLTDIVLAVQKTGGQT